MVFSEKMRLQCTIRYVIASNARGNPKLYRMVIGPDPRLTTSRDKEFEDHDEAEATMKRMVVSDELAAERIGCTCRVQPYAHGYGKEVVAGYEFDG